MLSALTMRGDNLKRIILHIGPHKTGSTAIQQFLFKNSGLLEEKGTKFVSGAHIHEAALAISKEDYEKAKKILGMVKYDLAHDAAEQFVFSQEDFSGPLLGKNRNRRIQVHEI